MSANRLAGTAAGFRAAGIGAIRQIVPFFLIGGVLPGLGNAPAA